MVWTRPCLSFRLGAQVAPYCGVWGWTANLEALVRNCHSCSCAILLQGEKAGLRLGTRTVIFLLLTSSRALGQGTKLTFSKGKRGERRTDGGRGRGEVREKAVPSVEAKAVLQIQTQPSQL